MSFRSPSPDGLAVAPNAPATANDPAASPEELNVHNFWGRYELVTQLPNVGSVDGVAVVGVNPAANPAYSKLAPGDTCLVEGATPPGTSKLYFCVDRGTAGGNDSRWNEMAAGDVVGPNGATDNAIARFDGTTGKLIKNSVAILTNAGEGQFGAGAVGTPSHSFTADPDTGAYNIGANQYGITTGGVLGLTIAVQTSGTSPNAAFTDSTRTGGAGVSQVGVRISHTLNQTSTAAFTSLDFVRTETAVGSGAQYFINCKAGAGGATQVFVVTNAGRVLVGDGTTALPALAWVSDAGMGLCRSSANVMTFSTGGASRMSFATGGITFASGSTTLTTTGASTLIAQGSITTAAGPSVRLNNVGSFTGSTAITQLGLEVSHTVNQSSTCGFTAQLINTTQTAVGSGQQLALDCAIATVSKFSVAAKGAVSFTPGTPAAMAVTENNYNGAGFTDVTFVRLTGNAANTVITGFVAPLPVPVGGVAAAQFKILVNIAAPTITINHQDAGSTAANRVQTSTGAAVVMNQDDTMLLIYDSTSGFWRQITALA